ncbi:hypothetical protein AMTRI_Chr06g193340 [Amborella trichopoda]
MVIAALQPSLWRTKLQERGSHTARIYKYIYIYIFSINSRTHIILLTLFSLSCLSNVTLRPSFSVPLIEDHSPHSRVSCLYLPRYCRRLILIFTPHVAGSNSYEVMLQLESCSILALGADNILGVGEIGARGDALKMPVLGCRRRNKHTIAISVDIINSG